MKKIIHLGEVAYYSRQKRNAVEIEIELKYKDSAISFETLEAMHNVPVLSICGGFWNNTHTDYVCAGQCIDEILEFVPTKQVRRIHELWKEYHLNDMQSGTKKQEEEVDKWREENNNHEWAYKEICAHLKSIGLYEDRGYKYGTKWLYMPIPSEVLEEIKQLINPPVSNPAELE